MYIYIYIYIYTYIYIERERGLCNELRAGRSLGWKPFPQVFEKIL